jgi:hypothetical protein
VPTHSVGFPRRLSKNPTQPKFREYSRSLASVVARLSNPVARPIRSGQRAGDFVKAATFIADGDDVSVLFHQGDGVCFFGLRDMPEADYLGPVGMRHKIEGKRLGLSRNLEDSVRDDSRNMLKAGPVEFTAEGTVAKAPVVFNSGESSKGGVEILGRNLFETDFVELFLKSRKVLLQTAGFGANCGGVRSILMQAFRRYAWNSSFEVGF